MNGDLMDVLAAARSGRPEALRAFVEAIWPQAYRLARAVLHDHGRAEDTAQEACALTVAALGQLRGDHAFLAWFRRIVLREAYRQSRRGGPEVPVPEPRDDGSASAVSSADLDLRAAVRALPPLYRVPLVLRYVEDLSSSEIGCALGLPAATVRWRLAVARRKLGIALRGGRGQGALEPHVRGTSR